MSIWASGYLGEGAVSINLFFFSSTMKSLALVTSFTCLSNDYDMPLLLDACRVAGFSVEICDWEEEAIDWSSFDAVLLRSPWNYTERLSAFLSWCERVASLTHLFNPLSVARWALDKYYLADLAAYGVPIVPTAFVAPGADPDNAVRAFLAAHPQASEIVIKPTVGAYSKDVQRFALPCAEQASRYVRHLLGKGRHVILQPYLVSIDRDGETNLVYFDGVYSHAIRKSPMLLADGTVNVPTQDLRQARVADDEERGIADATLQAAMRHLNLNQPLLYSRVDLIRDDDGRPVVLELEICEPSLNLSFAEGSATRFACAIAQRMRR